MKRFNVTMQAEVIVEFDEQSSEFKELWTNYKQYFDSNADYQSFAETIASAISRYGIEEFIEGIGYVKYEGKNQKIFCAGEFKEQPGYVNVEVDTDLNGMVDFESWYTEDLSEEKEDEE